MAFHRMIYSYDFLAIGGVAYEERLQKDKQVLLFDTIRACAAVVSAVIALIRLVLDLVKNHKKQKSNRPDQG